MQKLAMVGDQRFHHSKLGVGLNIALYAAPADTSLSVSVCLYVCLPACLPACLFVCLSVCQSAYASVCSGCVFYLGQPDCVLVLSPV